MIICNYLLGRDLVCLTPHVDLLVDVDAWNDEEDSWTTGSPRKKSTQAKYNCSFIFLRIENRSLCNTYLYNKIYLNNFDDEEQGQGQGGDDHEEGSHREEVGADAWALLAHLATSFNDFDSFLSFCQTASSYQVTQLKL